MANYGGFSPKRMLSGGYYSGGVNLYAIPAGDGTATFIGDLVVQPGTGTGEVFNDAQVLDVVQAPTGGVIVGAVVGFHADTRDSSMYRLASTLRGVYVCDDPNVLFEVPEVDTGTALAINDLGLNADFVVGTGNTTSGLSAMQVNNATEAGTNTLDLKLIGFENRPDNAVGSTARWLVRINRHKYANQVAGL